MASITENLASAIYSHGNAASDFKTAMTGGVFFERAWSSGGGSFNSFPYAVFSFVSDSPEYTYGTEIADVLIQWSIFDDTEASAVTLLDGISKLHTRFDDSTFSITGWSLMRMGRDSHIMLPVDDNGIRHSATTYRVICSKN